MVDKERPHTPIFRPFAAHPAHFKNTIREKMGEFLLPQTRLGYLDFDRGTKPLLFSKKKTSKQLTVSIRWGPLLGDFSASVLNGLHSLIYFLGVIIFWATFWGLKFSDFNFLNATLPSVILTFFLRGGGHSLSFYAYNPSLLHFFLKGRETYMVRGLWL